MGLIRGLAGAVLWILSALLGLVGLLLCVTIILLPLGIPILGYARRAFTFSVKLMLPRAVAHPIDTAEKSMRKRGRKTAKKVAAKKPDPKKMRDWRPKKGNRRRRKMPFRF
jgi:hypothetical protein